MLEEGEVVWMEDDLLVIKGSNFEILRRDEEGRPFIDPKQIRDLICSGKTTKLPAEGREDREDPEWVKKGRMTMEEPGGGERMSLG